MTFQYAAVAIAIAFASCYLSYRSFRTWKTSSKGCSGGCGCAGAAQSSASDPPKPVFIPSDALVLRRRTND